MPTSQHLIREARTWIGTPYTRGHTRKGEGARCDGFVTVVLIRSGLSPGLEHMNYIPHLSLARPGDVIALCKLHLTERDPTPRHLALVAEVSPKLKVIHAGPGGVEEVEPGRLFERQIHSIWRHPEVA